MRDKLILNNYFCWRARLEFVKKMEKMVYKSVSHRICEILAKDLQERITMRVRLETQIRIKP